MSEMHIWYASFVQLCGVRSAIFAISAHVVFSRAHNKCSHSSQRFANIVCINAKRHLWLENDFSFVTSFNEWWQINFDVARALSSLPQNLHHLARCFGCSDVD